MKRVMSVYPHQPYASIRIHGSIEKSGNSRGGGCSLIVTRGSFESDRLGSAAIE